jgi:hypothetical protein
MSRDVSGPPLRESRLPLRYRRANPPFPFLGRDAERAELSRRLREARVVCVHGPPGWGKSALVAAHLADLDASRPFVVRLDGSAPSDADLIARATRVLSSALGIAPGELPRADIEEDRVGQLVDLADDARAVMVIDDLGEADRDAAARLLSVASRYARHARWIVTTTRPLEGLAPADAMTLRPLAHEALCALARSIAPSLTEAMVARAAREAEGSPGQLLLQLSRSETTPTLDPACRDALLLLRALRLPVPREALEPAIASRELEALLARGVASGAPHAVRAQPSDAAAAPSRAALHRLAEALGRHESPEATIESVRLLLDCGDADAARTLLEARASSLFAAGFGAELWAVLAPHPASSIGPFRLLAAVEDGRPHTLLEVVEPGPEASPLAQLAWLKVRYALEDHPTVAARAFAIADAAEAAERLDLGSEARLMGASSLMARGDFDGASLAIARVRAPNRQVELQAQAVLAIVAARRGQSARARSLIEAMEPLLPGLTGKVRTNLIYNVALVLYGLGESQRAAALIARTFPVDGLATSALIGRRALEMDAHFSVLGGGLARARALLARLAKFVVPGTPIDARRTLIVSTLALLDGEVAAAREGASRGAALAVTYRGDEDHAYGRMLSAQAAWRAGVAPDEAQPVIPLHGVSGRLAHAWRALAQWAAFGRVEAIDVEGEGYEELAVLRLVLDAARALSSGVALDASLFSRAMALSSLPARAWTTLFSTQIFLAAGQDVPASALHALRDPLVDVADRTAVVETELRWLEACREGDLHALRVLSERPEGDLPQRWAAALLGGTQLTAWLGAKTVASLRARLRWVHIEEVGSGPITYFDAPRARLSQPLGAAISLEAHPVLVRLLATLAAQGGAASKETLVCSVWQVRDYHPLRHDNRLRLAVRKLRSLAPAPLLETTEDGYAIAGRLRWLGAMPSDV